MDGKVYQDMTPKFVLEDFFNGHIKGVGVVQNWRGQVVRRFDFTIDASWEGNEGQLLEDFNFYDGEVKHRTWHITALGDGQYTGTAGDIVGVATGQSHGNALQWQYLMSVPTDGKTYDIKFDDWMWLMNDNTVVNRSYMKKFGLTVGEISIFMTKEAK